MRTLRLFPFLLLFLLSLAIPLNAQWPTIVNRYPVPGAVKSTVADLNQDGSLDIAVLAYSTHEVVIEYGSGGGSFGNEQHINVGTGPMDIKAADLNNDGAIDLAVVNRDANSISVLLSDKAFGWVRHDFSIDVNANLLVLGDFNGDGNVDIAVPNGGYPSSTAARISVYLGNGDGTFRGGPSYNSEPLVSLMAQDVNRDGKVDLVAVTSGQITVWRGSGDGTFAVNQQITTSGDVAGASLGDLNNDNAPDIVTSTDGFCGHGCGYIEHLDVWLNSGSGTFSHKASYGPAGTETAGPIAIGSLTSDTNQDVVNSDFWYDPSLALYTGKGDGTLNAGSIIQKLSNYAGDVNIFDVDNDGRNDIVATEDGNGVAVLLNQSFTSSCRSPKSNVLQSQICSPLSGVTTTSPVHVLTTGNGPTKVLRMEAWLDGKKVYQRLDDRLDTNLTAAAGSHTLTINTYDYFGHVNKRSESFTIGGSSACTATGSDRTITVCSLTGSTVSSPVTFTAAAQDSRTVTAMQIYVDGIKKYQTSGKSFSTSLSLASGLHKVTIKAWDSAGSFSKSFSLTVTTSSGCMASSIDRTVTICTPANNATVSSPVTISAAARDSRTVSAMQVYVDGTLKYQVSSKSLTTSLSMASGTRKITVKAWDSLGSYSSTIYITVN